jgi:hypothetical protein
MRRRGLIFGYQHTALGLILFGAGLGVILCQTLEQTDVSPLYRGGLGGLLLAISGIFVRRPGPVAMAPPPP